jgi:hypothetical protein
VIADTLGPLGREVVANQHFYSQDYEPHVIARFARRWLEEFRAEETADDTEPSETFESVTGVAIEDFVTIGMGFWAASKKGAFTVARDYFATVDPSLTKLDRTLELVSADIVHLRGRVREDMDHYGVRWAFDAFEQYPIVRLHSGRLLILDTSLLVNRFFGWLPLYDITFTLNEAGDSYSKRKAGRVKAAVEKREESYFIEVLNALMSESAKFRRVYGDADLMRAYKKTNKKVADAAVSYGDAWMVFELTTSRLQRGSSAGISEEKVDSDLTKLIKEIEQIDHTINSLISNEAALTGIEPLVSSASFYPVLVVSEDFPINPLTVDQLRRRAKGRNLLCQPDVKPLQVLNIVELEMIEGLQGESSLSLRNIFDRKETAGLWRDSMRNFLLVELQKKPRCERVIRIWRSVVDYAAARIRPDDPDASDE